MVTNSYPCSQQELYTASELGWQSCRENLAVFSDFSAMYTSGYIDDREDEIESAMALPDAQARSAQSEVFLIQLKELAILNLANWQKLKRYIIKAFPSFQKPKLEEAGQNYYEKAGNNDWESCKGLLTSGSIFIDNNIGALTANLNMPSAFQTAFDTAKGDFFIKHLEFLNSEETSKLATASKMNANNNVYKKLIEMFLDGQEIFKNDEETKKQFVFDQVLNLVSGTGTAGIKGIVTDSITNIPIANVIVSIQDTEKEATTDEDGKYQIIQVAAGTYNIKAVANGYQEKIVSQQIKVGTVSTLNIELVV